MNEDGKNDWDRKTEEIRKVSRRLQACIAPPVDLVTMMDTSLLLETLVELERIAKHCDGLAETHRTKEIDNGMQTLQERS
jgi:hypothetical protein